MTILHIVLIDWKQGMMLEELSKLRATVRSMSHTIPGIIKIEEGLSVSPEGLEDGFDYGMVVTFVNADARDAYLPHPDHQAVAQQINAHCSRVMVFDIVANDSDVQKS